MQRRSTSLLWLHPPVLVIGVLWVSCRFVGFGSVPEQTGRVSRAAFPKGRPAIRLRDALGPVFTDTDFGDLFPVRGRPGLSPAMLTMVLLAPYSENLSDRQAAQAVAARIDWTYAPGLELIDTGFDHWMLGELRDRLMRHDAGDNGLLRIRAQPHPDRRLANRQDQNSPQHHQGAALFQSIGQTDKLRTRRSTTG